MKALFAITVLVLAHSSSQAQYFHVRDYQKTNLIASLDPGLLKTKINLSEDSSLRIPIFPKTEDVRFLEPQTITADPLSTSSITQANQYYRKKGKAKIDLSFLLYTVFTIFCDPYYNPKYTSSRP